VEVEAFGRVFARLDPEELAQGLMNWIQAVSAVTQGQVIAVDGQMVDQGGEDVLALKDKQEHLHQAVQALFEWAHKLGFIGMQPDYDQVVNQGHGRIEKRGWVSRPRWRSAITSAACPQVEATVRTHWEIENQVHWVLDIAFREDDSRIRIGHTPESFAVLRRIALNLLRAEKTAQLGIKAKRLKAGWSEDYLLKLLSH
jgi:predicted transposase YbfD/YdcC